MNAYLAAFLLTIGLLLTLAMLAAPYSAATLLGIIPAAVCNGAGTYGLLTAVWGE